MNIYFDIIMKNFDFYDKNNLPLIIKKEIIYQELNFFTYLYRRPKDTHN